MLIEQRTVKRRLDFARLFSSESYPVLKPTRGNWMESSNTESVAVIADQGSDKKLITRLLQNAGYSAGLFDSKDAYNTVSEKHSAMVVCHRRSTATPQPGLPACISGQRVVVFSDCTAEQTIVQALENGAHHFFDLRESPDVLQVRLEAALRQHALRPKRILDVAPFKFNLERRNVSKDGKLINLSPKEYEFAYYLFANRHRVVVNSELMTSVWSLPSSMDARRIDTAACRVRKKMQLSESSTGWCLRRIRRVGYELLWRGGAEEVGAAEQVEKRSSTPVATPMSMPLAHTNSGIIRKAV